MGGTVTYQENECMDNLMSMIYSKIYTAQLNIAQKE